MTHVPTQYEVETFSGQYVDVHDPQESMVHLEDIAHALSQVCRYGGHCKRFYSVAEHAVAVSRRLERKGHSVLVQLAGLHHDDAEAYLGDIPRPTKPLFGEAYEILSNRMDRVICRALGLEIFGLNVALFHSYSVKDADNWMLFVEARHLLKSGGTNWSGSQLDDWGVRQDGLPSRIVTPDYWQGGIAPEDAKQQFLDRHVELMGRI